MEEGAKRRLVGAAVMVLLLVIFLPMLLEEETQGPVPEGDLSIPPPPKFDRGYEASVSDGPDESVVSGESERPDSDRRDSGPLPQELAAPPIFEAPSAVDGELEPELEPQVFVREDPPAPEPKPAAKQPVAREPQPAPKAPPAQRTPAVSSSLATWVIQVASVRDQSRARALQQDLRGKGFPAFIEQADVKQKLWHRIRVGPEADRQRIESMAASIKAQTGLKVQIQRYP
jgi:DedD protein